MSVVVGTTEEELDRKIALMLHQAYQQTVRRVWVQDTTERGVTHYCEITPTGETRTLATHGRLSRLFHPKVWRALQHVGREFLVELDAIALATRTSMTPPQALVGYDAIGNGVGVLLISH